MATFTSRLALRMPDPTDLVSVTSDINASMSNLDAAVGFQSVTSLPSSPYSGKAVMVSTDSYRSYFNNGTVPASGGWVEIPNSSGTFGSDLKLASGAKLVIGVDTNLFRNAANVLRTNDALTVDGALTPSGGIVGPVTVSNNLTVGGDLKLVNGTTLLRNKLSSQTTVTNTVTETTVATLTIPANDAVAGAVYEIEAWGIGSVTGTPTFQFFARLGGSTGTQIGTSGSRTASSGITNHPWRVRAILTCLTTGVSGTWTGNIIVHDTISVAGSAPLTVTSWEDGTASFTLDTTASKDFVITIKWGTASSSNTAVCQGVSALRTA
jgi:hypothetical protein